jgi:hypothetical protein
MNMTVLWPRSNVCPQGLTFEAALMCISVLVQI